MEKPYAERTYTIYSGDKLIAEGVSCGESMDYIWDEELNTEEHPIRVIDESNGREIIW